MFVILCVIMDVISFIHYVCNTVCDNGCYIIIHYVCNTVCDNGCYIVYSLCL